jgi:hypothetical protein
MRSQAKYLLLLLILISITTALPAQSVTELITHYQADWGALNRTYSVQPSDQHFDRFEQFYHAQVQKLGTLNFNNLSHSDQVDYLLFQNSLERSLYFLKREHEQYDRISHYLPAPNEIMEFINLRRRGNNLEGQQVAEWMNSWFHETENKMAELESSEVLTLRDATYLSNTIKVLKDAIGEA